MHPEIVAYHEAGHYFIARFYDIPRESISIRPELGSRGRVAIKAGDIRLWDYCCLTCGGPIAHSMYLIFSYGYLPDYFEGCEGDVRDFIQAYNTVFQVTIRPETWGEEPEQLEGKNAEAFNFFSEVSDHVHSVLSDDWSIVRNLAEELVKREFLTGQQADTVILDSVITSDLCSKLPTPYADRIEKLLYEFYYPICWFFVKIRLFERLMKWFK